MAGGKGKREPCPTDKGEVELPAADTHRDTTREGAGRQKCSGPTPLCSPPDWVVVHWGRRQKVGWGEERKGGFLGVGQGAPRGTGLPVGILQGRLKPVSGISILQGSWAVFCCSRAGVFKSSQWGPTF